MQLRESWINLPFSRRSFGDVHRTISLIFFFYSFFSPTTFFFKYYPIFFFSVYCKRTAIEEDIEFGLNLKLNFSTVVVCYPSVVFCKNFNFKPSETYSGIFFLSLVMSLIGESSEFIFTVARVLNCGLVFKIFLNHNCKNTIWLKKTLFMCEMTIASIKIIQTSGDKAFASPSCFRNFHLITVCS